MPRLLTILAGFLLAFLPTTLLGQSSASPIADLELRLERLEQENRELKAAITQRAATFPSQATDSNLSEERVRGLIEEYLAERDLNVAAPAFNPYGADQSTPPASVTSAGAYEVEGGWYADYWGRRGDPEIEIAKQQVRHSGQAAASGDGKKWYDRLSIRGYAQFRINETIFEEAGSAPPQHVGDRSVGDNQSFLIRRARLIVSGDVSDHLYVYLQPDFASSVPGSTDSILFGQIRDWYGDCYLDDEKVHRFRVGQSKVPYGWENLQSSSNRIPLDRNDGMNSALRNERDLGVFYYWTPEYGQDFFKEVLDQGLKGSGNYGILGLGFYNGQGGSLQEQNDSFHFVARLTVPFQLDSGQFLEAGIQGYSGKYTVLSSSISPLGIGAPVRPAGTLETDNREGIIDQRVAGSFIWYPQPFGFQTECNVGRGPGLNDAQTEVVERPLYGGYAMAIYRYESDCHGIFFPFLRYNQFQGGYKPERNAPFSDVEEWELGIEWQLNPQMELTGMYTITDRTNTTAISEAGIQSYRQFAGELLRFQFQINY